MSFVEAKNVCKELVFDAGVDCIQARVNQPRLFERNATKPIVFVVAHDNGE